MSDRLAAYLETRIFYFIVNERKADEVSIIMYNTAYTLVRRGERWENHAGNKMTMSPGLIAAVMLAVGE